MSSGTTFQSTKTGLQALLKDIGEGKIQLPEFQRGWIWDNEHVKSILASISLSYPVGSVMILETGNPKVRFKPRKVEGVTQQKVPDPDFLILDGQQRLTSLFQALYSGNAVKTSDSRGKEIYRWYYVDMSKLLDLGMDREETIIGIPEDKKLRNFRGEVTEDYSTQEKECEAELFPLSLVFNIVEQTNWQMQYLQMSLHDMIERLARWNALLQRVIHPIQQYQVPVIQLDKETPKEAVCQVFEKVNTGGVPLNVFELLTAIYAADNFDLRFDWNQRIKALDLSKHKVLASLGNTEFLQAVTLLATYTNKKGGTETAVGCKRKDILEMKLEDYQHFADLAVSGFKEVARFLFQQNIFSARDLPYPTQMMPLAAIFALLGKQAHNAGVLSKLERWYWCGVFGELYGSAIETQFARDVPEFIDWINGGPIPSTIERATFSPGRLLTLQKRNSAAYKGIYALLLNDHISDFCSEVPIGLISYFDDKIDIHHIFPQAWCKTHGIEPKRCDSIINKTALSARTNRIIGGNAPGVYLSRLQNQAQIDAATMDRILSAHAIDPSNLRSNDFEAFFKAREMALLRKIEKAMGKPIVRDMLQEDMVAESDQDKGEYEEEEEMEVLS